MCGEKRQTVHFRVELRFVAVENRLREEKVMTQWEVTCNFSSRMRRIHFSPSITDPSAWPPG